MSDAVQPRPVSIPMPQAFQPPLAHLVFNGFGCTHTASEMLASLSMGDRQLALLIMPPVVAKSFAQSLMNAVEHYEKSTGTTVGTIDELSAKIADYDQGL